MRFKIGGNNLSKSNMSIPVFYTPQKNEGINVCDGDGQNNYSFEMFINHKPKKVQQFCFILDVRRNSCPEMEVLCAQHE